MENYLKKPKLKQGSKEVSNGNTRQSEKYNEKTWIIWSQQSKKNP